MHRLRSEVLIDPTDEFPGQMLQFHGDRSGTADSQRPLRKLSWNGRLSEGRADDSSPILDQSRDAGGASIERRARNDRDEARD